MQKGKVIHSKTVKKDLEKDPVAKMVLEKTFSCVEGPSPRYHLLCQRETRVDVCLVTYEDLVENLKSCAQKSLCVMIYGKLESHKVQRTLDLKTEMF